MNTHRPFKYVAVLLVPVMAAISAGQAAAQGRVGDSWNMSAKVGVLLPGSVYLDEDDVEVDTEVGAVTGLDFDFTLSKYVSLGTYMTFAYTTDEPTGNDAFVFSLGPTFKGRFDVGEYFQLRPGLALGATIATSELTNDAAYGLNIAAMLQFVIRMSPGVNALAELSFISQPFGGNDETNVTWWPIVFLAFGVEIGG